MLLNGATEPQVFAYITEISARIPFGILDSTTKKIVKKIVNSLPVPVGVAPIVKVNEKNYKSPVVSPRQPVVSIMPTAQSPAIPLIPTAQSPTQILQQKVPQPFQILQSQIPQLTQQQQSYKSPINVPIISSPKVNMQM